MKRSAKALFATVLAALPLPSLAQQPGFPQTMPPNTVYGRSSISSGPGQALPIPYLFTQFGSPAVLGLPVADPRNFQAGLTCAGGTDASTGIAAAITAGYFRVRLPAGCSYQPPTVSGNEVVPSGIQIVGDNADPNLGLYSLIKTANRATSSDGLYLGARSSAEKVATQSYFCDQSVSVAGTAKVCPLIGRAANIGDTAQGLTNWTYQVDFLISGASSTQGGNVSVDTPFVGYTQNNAGDGIYSATLSSSGVSHRFATGGNGDTAIFVQNGLANPANIHYGYHCAESGTGSTPGCIFLERLNGSLTPLQKFADDGSGTATTDWQQWVVQYQSGGNIRNTFQATTPFSGIFDLINAGNSGGTFTGQFVNYQVAGVSKYLVDYQGNLLGGGTLATSVPVTICGSGNTYAQTTTDSDLIANDSGATCTITLLAAASFPGRNLRIKTIQANTVISASSNVVPNNSATPGTAILAGTAGKWAELKSDGTNWIIMACGPGTTC